jgi:hypothetical protein
VHAARTRCRDDARADSINCRENNIVVCRPLPPSGMYNPFGGYSAHDFEIGDNDEHAGKGDGDTNYGGESQFTYHIDNSTVHHIGNTSALGHSCKSPTEAPCSANENFELVAQADQATLLDNNTSTVSIVRNGRVYSFFFRFAFRVNTEAAKSTDFRIQLEMPLQLLEESDFSSQCLCAFSRPDSTNDGELWFTPGIVTVKYKSEYVTSIILYIPGGVQADFDFNFQSQLMIHI